MINVVLYNPEIPFNTANIIRTCVATASNLHIIEPIGFDLSKEHPDLKRGSTNYLNEVKLKVHSSYDEFLKSLDKEAIIFYLTRHGKKNYHDISSNENKEIYIMFGKESTGIPQEILKKNINSTFRIPMKKKMRSLNLSNCVALVMYDLLAKNGFEGLEAREPHKIGFLD